MWVGGKFTLMQAGGHSQKDQNSSSAAAPVQATRRLRLILVEPRALVRDCVATCLRVAAPGSDVLEYASVHEVDSAQSAGTTALILSFLSANERIPDMAAEVSRAHDIIPKMPIVVIADYQELNFVREVISLGVQGYIPTSFDCATFSEAIQFVAAGGTFVPASVLLEREGLSAFDEHNYTTTHELNQGTHQNWSEMHEGVPSFTRRELEVVLRLRDGKSNKLIARELAITEGTVKLYIRSIMKKLGVENRTQAALLAANMPLAG
jgi:DNA-binding NarL/FixJ family response regulator